MHHAPPCLHHRGLGVDEHAAIGDEAAKEHVVDDLGRPRREAQQVAVLDHHRLRHLERAGEAHVLDEVARLAVHGHRDLGAHPLVHACQLVAARVARDVDEMVVLGDHLDAERDEAVVHPVDGELVAGNDLRREDHHVALAEAHMGMFVDGDARQRRPWLALAAGAQVEHLVGRQGRGVAVAEKGDVLVEVAGGARRVGDAPQRAPDEGELAAVRLGDRSDGLDARDVRGEAGDGDVAFVAADDLHEARAHVGFRARFALAEDVGRIAHHGEHARVAPAAQRRLVGGAADQRLGVDLPVAGVQHRPRGRADGERVGLGDRVRERDQLDLEGPELDPPAQRHLGDFEVIERPAGAVHLQLAAQHCGGERRSVDRAAQLRPQVGDGAQVILVRVGEHQADEVVAALDDETRIGQHHVDAGQGLVGEGDAEVDHQPLAAVAVEVEVHADLAGPAERQEQKLAGVAPRAHRPSSRLRR